MIATERGERRAVRRPKASRRILGDPRVTAVFLLAVAALGLVPAAPRVVAEAALLPARPSLELLRRGEVLDAVTQHDVMQALQTAQRFHPRNAQIATNQALVAFNEVRRDGLESVNGKAALLSAIAHLERGLSLAPADSFAWALLAQARMVREQAMNKGVQDALQNSYYMGAFDHGAMLARSEITLPHWSKLGEDTKPLARREILELWRRSWEDQKKIIAIVCRTGSVASLSDALRKDESAREEFDDFYEPYLSPEGCKTAP